MRDFRIAFGIISRRAYLIRVKRNHNNACYSLSKSVPKTENCVLRTQ